jgi:RNA polymerase sigma factor (sigma-70 family)
VTDESSSSTHPSLALLIQIAQANPDDDSIAMNRIVGRFEPLTNRLSRSLASYPHLRDDLANAARAGLVQAVRHHDPGRPTFPAFARVYMRGAALRERARLVRQIGPGTERLDPELPEPGAGMEERVLVRLAPWGDGRVAVAVANLAPEQQEIVHLRYVDDAPLDTIASIIGTTKSAVSQRLATIHRQVEREIAA